MNLDRSTRFDTAIAGALLVTMVLELEIRARHAPALSAVAAVAAMTVPMALRRRSPLAVAVAVTVSLDVSRAMLPAVHALHSPLFLLFLPAYAVAAYEDLGRAIVGGATCVAGPVLMHAIGPTSGSLVFAAGMPSLSWATGRIIRRQRDRATVFAAAARRLDVEREIRQQLALAEERSRIARELQAAVTATVSTMIAHAETAQQLLDTNALQADSAMATIEEAGRDVLAEMRRILGVLRSETDAVELAPQPGIGQLHTLIETARREQRSIDLRIDGDPGALPQSVDLALYRILEDALETTRRARWNATNIMLRFDERDVELSLTMASLSETPWPTVTMRERVLACDGHLDLGQTPGNEHRLIVRLPRAPEKAPV